MHRLQNLVQALSGRDLVIKTDFQLKKEIGDKLHSKLLEAVVEFVEKQKMNVDEFYLAGFTNCAFQKVCGYHDDKECDPLSRGKKCWLKTKLKENGKK